MKILYEKGLLGASSPEAILNTLWLNNSLHFGLRGIKEHHDIRWGDVKLCKTDHGDEYLEFNEHQTKTRTGADLRDVRAFAQKMFSANGGEKRSFRWEKTRKNERSRHPVLYCSQQCEIRIDWQMLVQVQRRWHQQTRESYEGNVKKSGSWEQ